MDTETRRVRYLRTINKLLWCGLAAVNLANIFSPYPNHPQWFSLASLGLFFLWMNHMELYGSKED